MTFTLDTQVLTDEIRKAIAEAMPTGIPSVSKMITKSELADALGVSESCIDGLRRDRIIKAYRVGKGSKSPVRFILDEVITDIKLYNTL